MYHSINIVPYKKEKYVSNAKNALLDGVAQWTDPDDGVQYAIRHNTWSKYHLVASERPSIAPPETKTNYVDIPGIDGALDLTDVVAGIPMYKNREGSWTFTVVNWFESWERIYHNLMNELHSKKVLLMLEDDSFYYYKGRLFIDSWKSGETNSEVTIKYNLQPFKYEFFTANEPWRWDPFNFNTGIIRNYGSPTTIINPDDGVTIMEPLVVNGDNSLQVFIHPTKRIHPLIVHVISGSITAYVGGGSDPYVLHEGDNNITDEYGDRIQDPWHQYIGEEGRTISFSGYGSLYIKFQGGML